MARGNGAIRRTNKCKCESPKWQPAAKRQIKIGKQFGKTMYMIYCSNCKSQWETSARYAKELFKEE